MNIMTEIVTFQTIENVTKEEFISIVDELEKNFHSLQLGFIDSELLFNDVDEEWIIIQHWDSMENMQLASKKMFDSPITETFINALNTKSVKMLRFHQLGVWTKN
ncbi:MAG: hypothetical protein FWG98_15060 [Candidatus Cloacimonetes bacterium]|nr:hypothetical protein [Candidatus Cloacimonadota bacterium]